MEGARLGGAGEERVGGAGVGAVDPDRRSLFASDTRAAGPAPGPRRRPGPGAPAPTFRSPGETRGPPAGAAMGQTASATETRRETAPRTRQSQHLQGTSGQSFPSRELRLLLLGKHGAGKSATGNTILGEAAFPSRFCHQMVTKMCQRKSSYTEGRKVVVIDTPDIFSSMASAEDKDQHIQQCLELSAPILHALLLVIPVGYYEAEDRATIEGIQEVFGAEARRHTLIIFTRGDELEDESVQDCTENDGALREMLAGYGNRYCTFNNKAGEAGRLRQVSELLCKVERMVDENGGPYHVIREEAGNACQDYENEAPSRKGDSNPHGPGKLLPQAPECPQTGGTSELKVLLVGKHGAGKSMAGNSLLGQRVFGAQPGTQEFQSASRTWKGREISIIDSPNLSLSKDFRSELRKHASPGPHAFLLVTPLGSFGEEDEQVLRIMENSFGDKFYEFLIILLTRKKDLGDRKLRTYLEDAALSAVLKKCGNRYGTLSYKATGAEEQQQVPELLDRLVWMVQQCGHRPCAFQKKTLNLVLIGRSGTGKSATGNTILGRSVFTALLSAQPVTKTFQAGKRTGDDLDVLVVDTPGLRPGLGAAGQDAQLEEMKSCVFNCKEGDTILVLVFQLGRFTREDKNAVTMLEAAFGEVALQYTILLFTRKEDLDGQDLEHYVKSTKNSALRKVVEKCGGRVYAFNNKETGQAREDQVAAFLKMANELIRSHGGQGYSQGHGTHEGPSILKNALRNMKEKFSEMSKIPFR